MDLSKCFLNRFCAISAEQFDCFFVVLRRPRMLCLNNIASIVLFASLGTADAIPILAGDRGFLFSVKLNGVVFVERCTWKSYA